MSMACFFKGAFLLILHFYFIPDFKKFNDDLMHFDQRKFHMGLLIFNQFALTYSLLCATLHLDFLVSALLV